MSEVELHERISKLEARVADLVADKNALLISVAHSLALHEAGKRFKPDAVHQSYTVWKERLTDPRFLDLSQMDPSEADHMNDQIFRSMSAIMGFYQKILEVGPDAGRHYDPAQP